MTNCINCHGTNVKPCDVTLVDWCFDCEDWAVDLDRINLYVDQAGRKLTDGRLKLDGIVHDYEPTHIDEFPKDLPRDNTS